MVQELPRTRQQGAFPESAPAALPVFYRTYSRRGEVVAGERETWEQVCDRTLAGLVELGQLTPQEQQLLSRMQRSIKALPFGPLAVDRRHPWIEQRRKLLRSLQLHLHQPGGLASLRV
jgi:hypothetical protein